MAIGNPDDPPQWSPPLTGGNTPNPLDSGCAVSSAAIEPPLTDENTLFFSQ